MTEWKWQKCSSTSTWFVFDFAANKILFAIVFVIEIVVNDSRWAQEAIAVVKIKLLRCEVVVVVAEAAALLQKMTERNESNCLMIK